MFNSSWQFNQWNPIEWLEEPLHDPLYRRIRVGDEFARVQNQYSIRQAYWAYMRAEREARRAGGLLQQRIRASAFFHLGELCRRKAIAIESQENDYTRYMERAASWFLKAAELFNSSSDYHCAGVAWRVYAWAMAQRCKFHEASSGYSTALNIFREQLEHLRYLGQRERITTYLQWTRELKRECEEIEYELRRLAQPRARPNAGAGPAPARVLVSPDHPPADQGRIWIAEEGFEDIPIRETEVAAFAPGRGYEGERIVGKARVGSVIFKDGEQYLPINLIDGSNYLNLDRSFHHSVIRVRGQSMNRAQPVPIEDGAWIVVRVPRVGSFIPENETIVVANIPEISGDLLLLKRIEITGSVVFLKSETSEPDLPEHYTRSFPRLENEELAVRFVGQAIAVLKPLARVQ